MATMSHDSDDMEYSDNENDEFEDYYSPGEYRQRSKHSPHFTNSPSPLQKASMTSNSLRIW